MNPKALIAEIIKATSYEDVVQVHNACTTAMIRLDAERRLREGKLSAKKYDEGIDHPHLKANGYKPSKEILIDHLPTKKLKLKCGCLISKDTKATVKSCGDAKHPVGRVVNIK